jgi:hypothetical protein
MIEGIMKMPKKEYRKHRYAISFFVNLKFDLKK